VNLTCDVVSEDSVKVAVSKVMATSAGSPLASSCNQGRHTKNMSKQRELLCVAPSHTPTTSTKDTLA
jgi:hypothetical protein